MTEEIDPTTTQNGGDGKGDERVEKRNPDGTFIAGSTIPGPGRPADTLEQKLAKKAMKEIIKDYKEKLAEALPLLSPVLIKKAVEEGDIQAIKELHDRVMGKPDITEKLQHSGEVSMSWKK